MKYDLIYNIPEATLYQATLRYTAEKQTEAHAKGGNGENADAQRLTVMQRITPPSQVTQRTECGFCRWPTTASTWTF